jgi:hypothetical protein
LWKFLQRAGYGVIMGTWPFVLLLSVASATSMSRSCHHASTWHATCLEIGYLNTNLRRCSWSGLKQIYIGTCLFVRMQILPKLYRLPNLHHNFSLHLQTILFSWGEAGSPFFIMLLFILLMSGRLVANLHRDSVAARDVDGRPPTPVNLSVNINLAFNL